MFSMSGKVCVVTGAGRGLGRGIALAYAKQGADVVLASRTRADLDEVAALVMKKGRRALVHVADVTDLARIQGLADAAVAEFGRIDVRVNAIAPAVVETPLTAPWLATEADRRDRATFYPLRRVGQPADVAGAAVYFASDEAAWVSGAVLLVSGGSVMTSDPYRYLMRV